MQCSGSSWTWLVSSWIFLKEPGVARRARNRVLEFEQRHYLFGCGNSSLFQNLSIIQFPHLTSMLSSWPTLSGKQIPFCATYETSFPSVHHLPHLERGHSWKSFLLAEISLLPQIPRVLWKHVSSTVRYPFLGVCFISRIQYLEEILRPWVPLTLAQHLRCAL